MIKVERVTTFEELDKILPLIDKLHEQEEYSGLFTKTGYFSWLISSFPNLAIWIGYEDEVATSYIIVGKQITYGKFEAVVYEAYCHNLEISDVGWNEAVTWAKKQGCTLISCYTRRGQALARRRGFTVVREYLTKEI